MDPLHDLASAAQRARPYRRPRVTVERQSSSTPVVLSIVLGAVLVGGAILFAALHSSRGSSTSAQAAGDQANTQEPATSETDPNANPVRRADFQTFARRMCSALAEQHQAALQAENVSNDAVVKFTCDYKLVNVTARRAGNGHPAAFVATFSGSTEGKGTNYLSNETTEISAALVPSPDGKWAVDSATERTLSRKTSSDLFGVPEKGGAARDISHTDWFHYAVNEALKQAAANG